MAKSESKRDARRRERSEKRKADIKRASELLAKLYPPDKIPFLIR